MKNKETFYSKALEYTTNGKEEAAIELLMQIIDEHPEYGKAHYLLGWIMFEYKNDLITAMYYATMAIEIDPENPLGYYLICDIMIANKNLEAIKRVKKGISKLKLVDKAYLYHKIACAYEVRKRYIEAISTLHKSKDYGDSVKWVNFVDKEILRIRYKVTHSKVA